MMIMSQQSISRTNSPIPPGLPHANSALSLPQSGASSSPSSSSSSTTSSRSSSLKRLIINTPVHDNHPPIHAPISLQDKNRICQWYCCECGQTYGSIIYKQKSGHYSTSASTDQSSIIENLKYYSQFIYQPPHRTHEDPETHDPEPDVKYDSDDSILQTNLPTLNSNNSEVEEIFLDPPTRFNCHRCNHMMCPYCLKVRIKDLDDDNN